ncbi:MAG: hypothetical protein N2Z59_06640 [Alteraurantiacibacter sp.]|nr:hypothetical protein [Alteraurantiacibacter sp.]
MIGAGLRDAAKLTDRLSWQAERMALAATRMRLARQRYDPLRWRKASWLWPLFTKD